MSTDSGGVSRFFEFLTSRRKVQPAAAWLAVWVALGSGGGRGLLFGQEAPREVPPVRRFRVTPASSSVRVDGVLDEPAWSDAVVIDLPYEWFPGDNVPAPVRTECRVTYDAQALYLGCEASDPDPSQIRAHLADRDDLERTPQDDHIGFLLDTFNDQRRAFQFRVNPLGVQMDAILSTSEGFEDFSWDAIWSSAGRITGDGYVVEVAIPFRSLRFPRREGEQTWGFIAFRSYPRSDRHRIRSSYTDRNNTCLLCQANKLVGFRGIAPGRNVELDPTLTSSRTDVREDFPDGAMSSGGLDAEPGVTAYWGVTPSLSLNATVNPDFSQVEADVAQLEVNRRFVLFFPEKRPFFLEGADYFLTPLQAVFTRTVADPRGGLKLTGKEGGNAVGLFVTRDRLNNLVLPSNQQSDQASIDQDVTGGVFRYRRDVGSASTLGLLYTGREAEGYHNRVYGADGFLQLSRSNTLTLQYLHSDTDYPDDFAATWGQEAGAFGGDGYLIDFRHWSRNWVAEAGYADLSPDFRADFGFIPRVDVRKAGAAVQRIVWGGPRSWFTRLNFGVSGERTEDHNGRLTDQSLEVEGGYVGPLQSRVHLSLSADKVFFDGVTYDLARGFFFFEIRPSGSLSLSLFGGLGDAIDFANSRKADRQRVGPGLQLSLGRHLRLELSESLERLSLAGERIFVENLVQTRLFYHFNTRSLVRLILQYRDVSRNVGLYTEPVEPETEQLFAQLLFSYKLNPQTVLFLGYSDSRLGTDDIALTQTDRTFFLKIGYAWRV